MLDVGRWGPVEAAEAPKCSGGALKPSPAGCQDGASPAQAAEPESRDQFAQAPADSDVEEEEGPYYCSPRKRQPRKKEAYPQREPHRNRKHYCPRARHQPTPWAAPLQT